jgi:hypothetical protein
MIFNAFVTGVIKNPVFALKKIRFPKKFVFTTADRRDCECLGLVHSKELLTTCNRDVDDDIYKICKVIMAQSGRRSRVDTWLFTVADKIYLRVGKGWTAQEWTAQEWTAQEWTAQGWAPAKLYV